MTQLREHVVEGRLTLDEFSERVGAALQARTRADLGGRDGRPARGAVRPPNACPSPRPATPRKQRRWHVAVMSGHSTKGRWRISGKTNAVAVMGGCDMDLRKAEIEGPEVEITAFAFWGGIDIVVPEGFDVELRGFSFMGGRDLSLRDVPIVPGSPRIVVKGYRRHGRHRRQEPSEPLGQAARPGGQAPRAHDGGPRGRIPRNWPHSNRTSSATCRPTARSPSSSATWSTTPA